MYTYYKNIEKVGHGMSVKNVTKISNPLTIVFLFAAIAEIAMTITISNINENLQATFIWFVMVFPILLVILFFLMWFLKPHYLYAPGDYKNEDNFMKTLQGPIKITKESGNKQSNEVKKREIIKGQIFINESVNIDNKEFSDCIFTNCKFVYEADGTFSMINNTIEDCSWFFSGKAGDTLLALEGLYRGFGEEGKKIVDMTFENIKRGRLK